jgi:hypothetical protein
VKSLAPGPLSANGDNAEVYPVLAAYFQLESLVPEDEARLLAAAELVDEWIGPELRHTHLDVLKMVTPYRADDLGHMTAMPARVEMPLLEAEEDLTDIEIRMAAPESFVLTCQGAPHWSSASPYGFVFAVDVHDGKPTDEYYPTRPAIRVTVPIDTPLEEFRLRVCGLAALLRVRWGNAGYSYSGYELSNYLPARDAIYRHSRRHVGFDVGFYATFLDAWHDSVRTVNWLTFVGPDLAARLAIPDAVPTIEISTIGDVKVLQATETPQAFDINRLTDPKGYGLVDRLIRPARAEEDVHFLAPWSSSTTTAWLRRFAALSAQA